MKGLDFLSDEMAENATVDVTDVMRFGKELPESDSPPTVSKRDGRRASLPDVEGVRLLCELGAKLVSEENIQTIYEETLSTAIKLMRADAGTVQILDEETRELVVLATRGFSPRVMHHFRRLDASSNTSCGISLASGSRTILHFDDPALTDPDESLKMYVEDGYRSAQSTPLVTRSGRAIGMLSTHWREHHVPEELELGFIDLLARQSADLIDHRRSDQALRHHEAELAQALADAKMLQEISIRIIEEDNVDAFHQLVLDGAVKAMDSDFGSLQLLRPETHELQLLAWNGFSAETAAAWHRVGADACVAGSQALKTAARHVTVDVETSELMSGTATAGFYQSLGIRSVTYTPLVSRGGSIVGLIGNHWRSPHVPAERELHLLDIIARQAADLIERRESAVALRESETSYRALFNSIDEGFCIIEMIFEGRKAADYRFLQVNPAFERQTGLLGAEGKTMRELVPNHESHWFETYGKIALTGESIRFDLPAKGLDGRWYDVFAFRTGGPEQRKVGILFNDITKRKKSEERIRESEERLRVALESAQMGAWDWDVETDVVSWNERHYLLFGLDPHVANKTPGYFFQFVHPEDREETAARLTHAVENIAPFRSEFRIIRADTGEVRWMSGYGHAMGSLNGRATRMTGVIYDCTERMKTEEALRKAHAELESRVEERTRELAGALEQLNLEIGEREKAQEERGELLKRLVDSQEEERTRISRELHDNLGQNMVAVKLHLDALQKSQASSPLADDGDGIAELRQVVDQLIKGVHRQAWELRPPELAHMGLEVALQHYVSDWSARSNVEAAFDAAGWNHHRLTPEIEIALYRVVQEAFTNVARHACAKSVRLVMNSLEGGSVSITDNGKGFDPAMVSGRLGLLGMKERMAIIGGSLEIRSSPGKGTTVLARLPKDMSLPEA